MNNTEFYERMKALLLTIPGAQIASGGKEIVMPCRYCQDKGKRMYVSLPVDNNIMLHNCFRACCGVSGVVTNEKLMEWGLYQDPNDLVELSKYNKRVSGLEKNRKYIGQDIYKLNNTFIREDNLSLYKLKRINDRLGTNLTFEDILNLKIVLNLKDLLYTNKINKLTRSEMIVDQLDESFFGFISKDNAFVNLRNLREEGSGKVYKSIDRRYVNYNIFQKYDNTQRYYTIPTAINILNPNRVKFNIAEGPFDILSVYLNLRNREDHSIYTAILGGTYLSTIKHFIVSLGIINFEIHLYLDNDVDLNDMINELLEIKYTYQAPIYIHRNVKPGEKDFGVTVDRIQESVFSI